MLSFPVQTSVLSIVYEKDALGEAYTFKFATPGVPDLVLRPAMLRGDSGWDTSPYFDKAVGIAQSKNAKDAIAKAVTTAADAVQAAYNIKLSGQPLMKEEFNSLIQDCQREVRQQLRDQKSRDRYMLVQEITDRQGNYRHRVFVTLNKNQRMDQKLIEKHEDITCQKLNLWKGRATTVGVYKL